MTGTVIRVINQKRFGFIKNEKDEEFFFHKDDFTGHWKDLTDDYSRGMKIPVEFEVADNNSKGPRAEQVRRIDHPNMGR